MATDQDVVDYIVTQSGLGGQLSHKKMFGEYALYLHGKVIALVCDNQLYLKPTDEGRRLLKTVSEHPPYPGAKLYFRLDDEVEDRDALAQVLRATADALPLPKPKAAKSSAKKRAPKAAAKKKP